MTLQRSPVSPQQDQHDQQERLRRLLIELRRAVAEVREAVKLATGQDREAQRTALIEQGRQAYGLPRRE